MMDIEGFFRTSRIGSSLVSILPPILPFHPLTFFRCHSDIYFYAIGFVYPFFCQLESVIPNTVVLASVVFMLSLSFANMLDVGLRVTFAIFNRSIFVVFFPKSIVQFFSIVFSANTFVLRFSIRTLLSIVSLRGTILVLLCFPVALISFMLPVFFVLFDSLFIDLCSSHFNRFIKTSDSFLFAR